MCSRSILPMCWRSAPTANTLRVSGDGGDSIVSSAQGWVADAGGVQTIDGVQSQAYSADSAHLLVALEMTATLS